MSDRCLYVCIIILITYLINITFLVSLLFYVNWHILATGGAIYKRWLDHIFTYQSSLCFLAALAALHYTNEHLTAQQ